MYTKFVSLPTILINTGQRGVRDKCSDHALSGSRFRLTTQTTEKQSIVRRNAYLHVE